MRYLISVAVLTIVLAGLAGMTPAMAATGLLGRYYDDFSRPDDIITFADPDLVMTRIDPAIDFWNAVDCHYRWNPVASANWYGVRWTGSLRIDMAGEYAFGTISDDGSQVWLDGELIVDNGETQWWDWEDSLYEGSYTGLYPEGHGPPDDLPGPLYLTVGHHSIEVRHFEAASYDGIELWWLKPGSGSSDIPYYGTNCGSADLSVNTATNWEIVPTSVLTDVVVATPEQAGTRLVTLHPPVPNPFNPKTRIQYDLPEPGVVDLRIHDASGRLVRTLVGSESLPAGLHEATWDGRDDSGRPVGAGVYFYRLHTPGFAGTGKMALVR
jgi:hypothetical protein